MAPPEPVELSEDERAALDALLGDAATGDQHADLVAACRETMRRRADNSRLGGHVIAALYRSVNSWRIVEYATGIPASTARTWATPPEQAPSTDDAR